MKRILAVATGLAFVTVLAFSSAKASSIEFTGVAPAGTFSYTLGSGNTLSVSGSGLTIFTDTSNATVSTTGTLDLTSGGQTSTTCPNASAACISTFGSGGSLTLTGTIPSLGINTSTTLVSASFSSASASIDVAGGSGSFSGTLSSISLDPLLGIPFSGSDAQAFLSVTDAPTTYTGDVNISGVTIGVVPEPGSLALLGIAMLGAALVWGKKLKSSDEVEC